ncbi:Fungalysin metallopeptidase-domain-containing protein [Flammula alnicola]|nr:Fungalysin metallopeptidase-domain-containing protein [Flammula alnicola]KAF8958841.1 Fungalysin metallopeptidase-domain-containing protein [Flammula alnicola]
MPSFLKLLKTALLAVACASLGFASPLTHATRRSISIGSGLHIESFHPTSTFETFDTGIDHPLSKRSQFNLEDAAIAFLCSRLSTGASTVAYTSGFSGEVSDHAFLTQVHDGVPFSNAVANVAFNKDNQVVSFGSSFVNLTSIAENTPGISLTSATSTAEKALNGSFNNYPPTVEFFAKPDNTAVLTYVIQIQNDATGAWFEAFVDAHSGELVSVTNFVTQASYLVLPMQEEILTQGFQVLTDPEDLTSSPLGWHSTGTVNTTETAGNNAISFKASQANTTSESSNGLNFIFKQDPTIAPTVQSNLDAARVNAFYVVNTMHDLTYKYGFTESSFNFQNNNFGNGGVGNDRVTISVQDAAGTNNADFATPADGTSGRMRMFLWTSTSPMRDGALENDIVTHEMTHGVTNRMTGGGTGRCLQTTEAGGMGEGWSDTMAIWNEQTSAATPDFVLGQYVTNNPAGIRTHPYSTNATINPLQYSDLQTRTEVHAIGEIWANMLFNVYANLVNAHGFSATARTDPTTSEGNVVFLHLFIDSLAIQPCNPTFVSARDAWLQADVNRFGGANACLLWEAFGSRGLGVGAANHTNSFLLPPACVTV